MLPSITIPMNWKVTQASSRCCNSPTAYHDGAHQAIVAPRNDPEDHNLDSDSVGSTVSSVQGSPEPRSDNRTSTLSANASDLDSLS